MSANIFTFRLYSSLRLAAIAAWLGLTAIPYAGASPVIQQWETRNGARVYFVPAPELPILDLRIVFDAGAARDEGKGGLAQLANGLLNEGAGNLDAGQIAQRFEGVGANYGNGSYRDMAVVSLRSLTDAAELKTALDTLELVLNKPSFPKDAFDRERNRMLIALRGEQESPGDIADKAFFKALYNGHPYVSHPLGSEESLARLTREDLVTFYRRYYVAKNTVIAIVGGVDRKKAAEIAEKIVGALPPGAAPSQLPGVKELAAANLVRIDYPSEQTHVMMGQPGISRKDKDYFALIVGNHILGGSGLVSRINDEVREKRGLSYSAYSAFAPMRVQGPFIAGLQTRNDQAEAALQVMKQVILDFIDKGPTEQELTAAKKNITGGFPLRIASNSKIVENVAMIGYYNLPLNYLDTYNAQVEAVTAEQIRDAFRRRVQPEHMATVIVGGQVETAGKQ